MIAALVFLAAYGVIALGRAPFLRIDRTGAAIVGAVLMVATGVISFDAAVRSVDVHTIVLLFSMMIIVAHLRMSGGLSFLADAVSRRIADPAALVVALVFTSGLLSALFVNDTICLVLTPVVLDVTERRGLRPLPFLLALATSANIGSAATLTGNPQNILIGAVSGISFGHFASRLAPIALVSLAVDALLISVAFRKTLGAATLVNLSRRRPRVHRRLFVKTLVVMAGVLAGFLAGYDTALVAASGAAALLVTRRVRPRKVYGAVDWDLLVFFVGLFVIVGAGAEAGIDHFLLGLLRPFGVTTLAGLSVTSAIVANLVSNVPSVMLFTTIVPMLPHPDTAWLTLAMASSLSGNVTILGSIANLIVVEGARRRGVVIGFLEYAMLGVPLGAITIAWGIFWLSRY
jgi:Na+/H+ antiporter NhaD/arsenite permease-like protein